MSLSSVLDVINPIRKDNGTFAMQEKFESEWILY